MRVVANYEIKSECSVISDDQILRIEHPKGHYGARIKNIPRTAYDVPFLLSLHLTFDAASLQEGKEVADDSVLPDWLNMLAFTTGGAFRRHRLRQIVDVTAGTTGMRSVLMWTTDDENQDPQPFLDEKWMEAIERLSQFDVPPPIRRAMRWYRLGVNAVVPDDQFMNFWFALEIVAEFNKPTEKVHDKCSKCHSPLYCEQCATHPVHRPYAKQAIRALLKTVDSACDDATIERLDKTRNGLMHGLHVEGN
jgi:hypothetical protein